VPAYVIFPDRTLIEMAEKRPSTLDDMARIGGVGAKKLDRYGTMFLQVITGAEDSHHPQQRKLAGSGRAAVFDQLLEVQTELTRGADGTHKPLSCSAAQLAKVAQLQADDQNGLQRVLGESRAERFGPAFLDVLRAAG
jgi:ATP-dependent DNA helicase RecQ